MSDHIVNPTGWVIDMRHYLDEDTGDLPDGLPTPALNLRQRAQERKDEEHDCAGGGTGIGSLCRVRVCAASAECATNDRDFLHGSIGVLFPWGRGFVRKGGSNLGGACIQVAVRATDSAALVGELCGTHQFLPRSSQDDDGRRRSRWPLSEPAGQQVDSLLSIRGGMRLSKRTGSRMTTFVQGLVGVETGYRHGGFADDSGFSLAAGGGVDISLTNWLAYEIARANYQTTRVGGTTVNGLRFGTGPVFRIGKIADQSRGAEESSPQP